MPKPTEYYKTIVTFSDVFQVHEKSSAVAITSSKATVQKGSHSSKQIQGLNGCSKDDSKVPIPMSSRNEKSIGSSQHSGGLGEKRKQPCTVDKMEREPKVPRLESKQVVPLIAPTQNGNGKNGNGMKKSSSSAASTLSEQQLKMIKRGEAPLHLIEASKNQKKDAEWKEELKKYKPKRQRLPNISPQEKRALNKMKEEHPWPQGSCDYEEISRHTNIEYHKVRYQYSSDPSRNEHVPETAKRQMRKKITKIQKEEAQKAVLEGQKLDGSVDVTNFVKTSKTNLRRDQLENQLRH